MSRAWQAERAAEREEEALSQDYAEGRISREEYNAAIREIQRDMRDAYAEDLHDAEQRVRDEWGW